MCNWKLLFLIFALTIIVPYFVSRENNEMSFMCKPFTDCIRGIAIILIILCHYMNQYSGKTYFTPLGGIGVALFLIVSGYGLTKSYQKNGFTGYHWWVNRIKGAILPYALCQIVLYWIWNLDAFSVQDFLLDITCIRPLYGNGWYMQYILIVYVIFFATTFSEKVYSKRYVIWIIFAIVTFALPNKGLWSEQALSFIIGIYIAENTEKVRDWFNKRRTVELLLVLLY